MTFWFFYQEKALYFLHCGVFLPHDKFESLGFAQSQESVLVANCHARWKLEKLYLLGTILYCVDISVTLLRNVCFLIVLRGCHAGDWSTHHLWSWTNLHWKCEEAGRDLGPPPMCHGYPTPVQMWALYWPVSQEEVAPKGFNRGKLNKGIISEQACPSKNRICAFLKL